MALEAVATPSAALRAFAIGCFALDVLFARARFTKKNILAKRRFNCLLPLVGWLVISAQIDSLVPSGAATGGCGSDDISG